MEARQRLERGSFSETHDVIKNNPAEFFPVIEAGVDWLTVTCADPDRFDRFRSIGCSLVHVEAELGCKVKPWRFSGFEGLACGGAAFGETDAMQCLRLSSTTASNYWRQAYAVATNCSRIDVQVTVRTPGIQQKCILDHHRETRRAFNSWSKPPTIDLRLSNRTSPTLYLNSRSSGKFGRIYDKADESKLDHYVGCLRYELQCGGAVALSCARKLLTTNRDERMCCDLVAGFFLEKRCRLRWHSEHPTLLSRPRQRAEDLRSLRWLATQVAPRIKTLLAKGYHDELEKALGIIINLGPDLDQ